MTRAEKWTLRFYAALTLGCLMGVAMGIFGHGPRWGLVLSTIGLTTSAWRFAEIAEVALQAVARKAEERPEGRR